MATQITEFTNEMLQETDSSNLCTEAICLDKANMMLNLYTKLIANPKQTLSYVICF